MTEPGNIHERRRFIRLKKPLVIKYSHIGELKNDEAFTGENISAGGICVIIKEPLTLGAPLNLRVYLPDNTLPIKIKGKVAWSKQVFDKAGQKLFETGIEFVEINDLDFKKIAKYVNDGLPLPLNKS